MHKEGEYGKPSKQQSFEKKPVLKGGETNRPPVQEKSEVVKPPEQTDQKNKEEKQKEER